MDPDMMLALTGLGFILTGICLGLWSRLGGVVGRGIGTGEGSPSVSVIIPARNEAHNLPRLLASLTCQKQGPLEIIVVDDGSTDGTADVARVHGAKVVNPGSLPDGWRGKPWA